MTNEEAWNIVKTYMPKDEPMNAKDREAFMVVEKVLAREDTFDRIISYIEHVKNTGMGKTKSLEYIKNFVKGLDTIDAPLPNKIKRFKDYISQLQYTNTTYWGNPLNKEYQVILNKVCELFKMCFGEEINRPQIHNERVPILEYKYNILEGAIQELLDGTTIEISVRGEGSWDKEYYVNYKNYAHVDTKVLTQAESVVKLLNFLEIARTRFDFTLPTTPIVLDKEIPMCKTLLLKHDAKALITFLTKPTSDDTFTFWNVARNFSMSDFVDFYDKELKGKTYCHLAYSNDDHYIGRVVTEKTEIDESNVINCVKDTLDYSYVGGVIGDESDFEEYVVGKELEN